MNGKVAFEGVHRLAPRDACHSSLRDARCSTSYWRRSSYALNFPGSAIVTQIFHKSSIFLMTYRTPVWHTPLNGGVGRLSPRLPRSPSMIDLSAPPASLSSHRAFVVQFRAETAVAAGHLVSISSRAGSHVRHLGR